MAILSKADWQAFNDAEEFPSDASMAETLDVLYTVLESAKAVLDAHINGTMSDQSASLELLEAAVKKAEGI